MMKESSATNQQYSSEPRRRLSPWRVMLALFILVSLPAGIVFAQQQWHASQPTVSNKPWFASYVDVILIDDRLVCIEKLACIGTIDSKFLVLLAAERYSHAAPLLLQASDTSIEIQ